jgi:outer membrane receptor protein involved in Fe transport
MPQPRCNRSVYVYFVAFLLTWSAGLCITTEKRLFDVEAGEAIERLKSVAYQEDVELMFESGIPPDVTTNPIYGKFTIGEALEQMLMGTPLEVVPVSDGSAFGIVHRTEKQRTSLLPSELPKTSEPTLEFPSEMNLTNKTKRKTFFSTLATVLTLGVAGGQGLSAQDADYEGPVYELSPFTVDATENSGYTATSTLSGTRIRTDLKDLGAAISVVTSELMDDLGATDASTLLSYTANTEVGGNQGNFAGGNISNTSRIDISAQRANPQNNQRVRGLFSADLTRGLFLTDIPFDSFNTSRVTISRGPNSLLFGIGSPGGVIDNSLKEAIFNENFGEVKVRFDNYGSLRSELDINRSFADGRVALRIAGLYDDAEFKQEPAWNRDERFFGSFQAVLFENERSEFLDATRLKINGETGTSKGSPVEIIPPSVAYDGWFAPTPANLVQFTGENPTPNVISPSEGGNWKFQETYNPFQRNSEGQIFTNVHPAFFQGPGVTWTNPNSANPDVGTGDGLEINYGAIPWGSKDTLDSTGLAGTPAAIATFGPDAPGTTVVKQVTEYHTNSPYAEPFAVGFTVPTLQNRDVFDYRNKVYSGGIDHVERKFDAKNFALEQTFFDNKFGIDIAYDDQHYEYTQDFFFAGGVGGSTGGPYDIYVTISEYLTNGQPNPNFGRAYTRVSAPVINFAEKDRETFRVTAFGEIDFSEKDSWLKHFGKHRFTGLFSDYELNTHGIDRMDTLNSTEFDSRSAGRNRRLNQSGRWMNAVVYTSDSLLGLQSPDDVRLEQINIPRPQNGDTYDGVYVELLNVGKYSASNPAPRKVERGEYINEQILLEETIGRTEIESKALSWQSYFLDEHIIGLLGYREDDTKSFGRASEAEVGFDDSDSDGRWDPTFTRLSKSPSLVETGDSLTWSVVGRYPEKLFGELPSGMDLQVHYAESENFNPIGLRNNALGESIGQPTGTTKEYGFTASFADNRFSVKVNWFETSLTNIDVGFGSDIAQDLIGQLTAFRQAELGGKPWAENITLVNGSPEDFPIKSYDQYYQLAVADLPTGMASLINPRQEDSNGDGTWDNFDWDGIQNLSSTRDLVAEGLEVELVANPAAGWRLLVNISRQESVNSNTAPVMLAVWQEALANSRESRTYEVTQQRAVADRTQGDTWFRDRFIPLVSLTARDGTKTGEQREWRFTGVSNYEFLEGRLKGVEFGGAIRWEDEAATGYVTTFDPNAEVAIPFADTSRPFLDDGLFSGDLWAAYSRKIWDNRIDWRIQLNIRNAFGDNGDIPVVTNPNGEVAVIRIPNPRTIYLSNSFRF